MILKYKCLKEEGEKGVINVLTVRTKSSQQPSIILKELGLKEEDYLFISKELEKDELLTDKRNKIKTTIVNGLQ